MATRNPKETIPGGIYLDPKHGYVNANGELINPDGTKRESLCDCDYKKPFIIIDFAPDFFILSSESVSSDGSEKTIKFKKISRPEHLSEVEITKKANEIFDETDDLKETYKQLANWIDEEIKTKKGRPPGSKNKNTKIKILKDIEKFIWNETAKGEADPKIKDIAKKFKISERVLRDLVKNEYKKNWKGFVTYVIENNRF